MNIPVISNFNSVTGLPGNEFIQRTFNQLLNATYPYTAGCVKVNAKDTDSYTLALQTLGLVMSQTICERGGFVGHSEDEQFYFCLPCSTSNDICQQILYGFESLKPLACDTVTIAVTDSTHQFSSALEMTQHCSNLLLSKSQTVHSQIVVG